MLISWGRDCILILLILVGCLLFFFFFKDVCQILKINGFSSFGFSSILSWKVSLFCFVCTCECLRVGMPGTLRGQERALDPWNLSYSQLWAVRWVLGIEPRSSTKQHVFLTSEPSCQSWNFINCLQWYSSSRWLILTIKIHTSQPPLSCCLLSPPPHLPTRCVHSYIKMEPKWPMSLLTTQYLLILSHLRSKKQRNSKAWNMWRKAFCLPLNVSYSSQNTQAKVNLGLYSKALPKRKEN